MLVSCFVGFVCDVMIVVYLGMGLVVQVYLVVFILFNMFCCFFVEGVFNIVFVLMFFKWFEVGDNLCSFVEEVFLGLFLVVLVVLLIVYLVMLWLVYVMVVGFKGDEWFDLVVIYGCICFFYILFILLMVLLLGLLNVGGWFMVVVVVLVLMNFVLIVVMLLVDCNGWDMGMVMVWFMLVLGIV